MINLNSWFHKEQFIVLLTLIPEATISIACMWDVFVSGVDARSLFWEHFRMFWRCKHENFSTTESNKLTENLRYLHCSKAFRLTVYTQMYALSKDISDVFDNHFSTILELNIDNLSAIS